ncbi:hypothetical protein V6R85_02560 [Agrobacterium sp. CCNWLW32]|uniref:hypothetical protein n=1 Tax=Agrobacterium sp. CCNWLW32 TaxID=3122072 RepID=UPI0012DA8BA9
MTNNEVQHVSHEIECLSLAAEFLMSAVRALAIGADPNGLDVSDPVKWATAKIQESKLAPQRPD